MLNAFLTRLKSKPKPDETKIFSQNLIKKYQTLVTKQQLKSDPMQMQVLQELQTVLNQLEHTQHSQSVYIFGGVGRGKSMLMELFFRCCPLKTKQRLHFHDFMLSVHQFVHTWRQTHQGDPFLAFATEFRNSTQLLCLDEFEVIDIADAMIITRLFKALFAQGLILVTTSNSKPQDLYKNGLQRELFLPFIQQLQQVATCIGLNSPIDYRKQHTDQSNFYIGQGIHANNFLQKNLNKLTTRTKMQAIILKIQGRAVSFKTAHQKILYSDFNELCQRTLGVIDYLHIAQRFNTVFIADIPQLSKESRDQARRFVTLIDALYEHQVQLICSIEVTAEHLYIDDGVFEFKRTQSRLFEMQSRDYLH